MKLCRIKTEDGFKPAAMDADGQLRDVRRVFCIGLNHYDLAKETGTAIPEYPILFMKACDVTGANDPIVIGSRALHISEDDVMDHIAGYCVAKDVSERACRMELGSQWGKGKSANSLATVGPYPVTKDEFTAPQDLRVSLVLRCAKVWQSLVQLHLQRVLAVLERTKEIIQIGVIDRFAGIVGDKVLFGHVGHVKALVVFGQKVIKRLVFFGAAVLWNGVVPFVGVGEHGIHVKNHTPKGMLAVADHLAQMIFGACLEHE